MHKFMLNATYDGNILDKETSVAFKLIERVVLGGQTWHSDSDFDRTSGKLEVDTITKLAAEVTAMRYEFNQSRVCVAGLHQNPVSQSVLALYDRCGKNHNSY